MLTTFNTAPTKKQFLLLFLVTFALRAMMFAGFMQHRTLLRQGYEGQVDQHVRYNQPDSPDYHQAALCLALGNGMSTIGTNQPIFWRTPGYPLYLAAFYKWFGITSADFNANQAAQRAALWVQIFVCSFIPIILFYLAYLLTGIYLIAWLTAWISALHIGLILASTYLLTEGLGMIFFYLFLIFFYRLLLMRPIATFTMLKTPFALSLSKRKTGAYPSTGSGRTAPIICALSAALTLSIYTWIRPMGEFVGIIATGMLLLLSPGSWSVALQQSLIFAVPFFTSLLPWYWRNYTLTGGWFFCPLSGIYLNCFCAPKILRRTMNISLLNAWKYTQQLAQQELRNAYQSIAGTGKFLSPLLSRNVALPIITAYPLYFALDWIQEALKTLLDLYSSQFPTFVNNTFWYDPLEDFLLDKTMACLWSAPLPLWMRILCWTELVYALLLWVGLLGGAWVFMFTTFFTQKNSAFILRMRWLWFVCGIIIGAVVAMTGGFGYARLRLPVEPLMIILSLTFWYWFFQKNKVVRQSH